jgi:F0F1-type ATP synthase epsilon subunit
MEKQTIAARKASKLEEIAKLKADVAVLEKKEATRIGKIAVSSGLADVKISEADLKKEFVAIASRFSKSKIEQTQNL